MKNIPYNSKVELFASTGNDDKRCHRALFLTDPTNDQDAIIISKGKRATGTCDSIIATNTYNERKQAPSGLLWIFGGPGEGKTFLLISFPKTGRSEYIGVYFFCANKDVHRNPANAVLRGLLYQLIQQNAQLTRHLLPLWRVQQDTLFLRTPSRATGKSSVPCSMISVVSSASVYLMH